MFECVRVGVAAQGVGGVGGLADAAGGGRDAAELGQRRDEAALAIGVQPS